MLSLFSSFRVCNREQDAVKVNPNVSVSKVSLAERENKFRRNIIVQDVTHVSRKSKTNLSLSLQLRDDYNSPSIHDFGLKVQISASFVLDLGRFAEGAERHFNGGDNVQFVFARRRRWDLERSVSFLV